MGFLSDTARGFFGGTARGAIGKFAGPARVGGAGMAIGSGIRSAFGGTAGRAMLSGAGLGAVSGALSSDGSMLGGAVSGAMYGYGYRGLALGLRAGASKGAGAGFRTALGALRKPAVNAWKGLGQKAAMSTASGQVGKSAVAANDVGKRIKGLGMGWRGVVNPSVAVSESMGRATRLPASATKGINLPHNSVWGTTKQRGRNLKRMRAQVTGGMLGRSYKSRFGF